MSLLEIILLVVVVILIIGYIIVYKVKKARNAELVDAYDNKIDSLLNELRTSRESLEILRDTVVESYPVETYLKPKLGITRHVELWKVIEINTYERLQKKTAKQLEEDKENAIYMGMRQVSIDDPMTEWYRRQIEEYRKTTFLESKKSYKLLLLDGEVTRIIVEVSEDDINKKYTVVDGSEVAKNINDDK